MKGLAKVAAMMIAGNLSLTRGDEGMWLFNDPPTALLKERYGFDRDAAMAGACTEGFRAF